ncbi:short chain dehydrogenase [Brenneria tiliae]|uniref:Short chain dehydrogenase n=1 Tax=Brenneria tiliae TaxID=2914984 RepID=A0ABT0MV52_9GAMM|nr:short chain dehydrogenase [Brenneria tiliae]MCL2893452.1 short chain dehydrogenase [Brenneria tiliae]
MRILIIGASGAVGSAVARELGKDHHILTAGRHSGDFQVDLTSDDSVSALFANVGTLDAIVSATGNVHFGPLDGMSAEQFQIGLQDKLLGQVRIVLQGQHHLSAGGSITLTTGVLAQNPIRDGVNATTVNAALEGFILSAACELRNIRLNGVSPTVLTESLDSYGPFFPGFESAPGERVAKAYRRSVEGVESGRIYRVW